MKTLHSTIEIRGFEPHTHSSSSNNNQNPRRKKEIRDKLIEKIGKHEIDDLRIKCSDKRLFICVRFYLWNISKPTERAKKDLDNLLKLLLDSICEHIEIDDKEIFQIHADKKLVNSEAKEGFDIDIFEYLEH